MQTIQYFPDPDDVLPETSNLSWRARLFWTVVFFGPATYFGFRGDYIAAAMTAIAGFSAFAGYRTGVFSIFASMVAIAAAVAFAPAIGMENAYRFSQWFGLTGLANRFLSIGVVGLAIGLFVMFCLWFILGSIVRRRRTLDRWNRRFGFTLGIAQGVVGLACFIGGVLVMEPIELKRVGTRDPADTRGQIASKLILSTAEATRQSVIGPYLVKYNPLAMVPQLNKVEEFGRTATVLGNPAKMQELLDAPEIQELRQKPEVRKLVNQLNSDPEVREIVQSGQAMTPSMAMTLLNHPAVMELIDQPGFLEQATKAIQKAIPTPGMVR
ncbi:MAG: CvpA family protein [Rubripirellula sp.]